MPVFDPEASVQERIEKGIFDIAFFIAGLQFKKYIKKPFYTVFPNNVSSKRV